MSVSPIEAESDPRCGPNLLPGFGSCGKLTMGSGKTETRRGGAFRQNKFKSAGRMSKSKIGSPMISKFGEEILSADARSRSPPPAFSLIDMPEGAYLSTAFGLDERSLCSLDFACRASRALNQAPIGPWRALGVARYRGVELEKEGKFGEVPMSPLRARMARPINWKSRYFLYAKALPTFRAPFRGREITRIDNPDEVVYCRCMVPRVQLSTDVDVGVYMEILVRINPDNLSIALVDFEAGGHSSVTFSPDTGAVIRERKIQEAPRKVEGAYVQPLNATSSDEGAFEGSVGIYVNAGHVAFFRRRFNKEVKQPSFWETTGYITDLNWAEGPCVTPCIAFRDEGIYHVRIVGVGSVPPMDLGRVPAQYDESRWTNLDWEAADADE